MRLFVCPQEGRALSRLAYTVTSHGKLLLETSYLGLDIWEQEPLLGETTGLISDSRKPGPGYNSVEAHFMQNGSLGRLINVEIRAYDDGVAFRYVVPRSLLLKELLIADEATEFALAGPLDTLDMAITEVRTGKFPAMRLEKADGMILISRLAPNPARPRIAFEGTTPFTGPWRVVVMGPESKHPDKSKIALDLSR